MGNLSSEELREARSRGGKISGNKVYREGRGIFALSEEERKVARSTAGRKGGQITFEKGVGIYKQGKEGASKAGLVGGISATLVRGQVPWRKRQFYEDKSDLAEIEVAHNLFVSGMGIDSISNKLNRLYHNGEEVRSYSSVKAALWKFRKGLIKHL